MMHIWLSYFVTLRGSCTVHVALSFDQPFEQGLLDWNLEPDEQHVDHTLATGNLYGPVLRRERPV